MSVRMRKYHRRGRSSAKQAVAHAKARYESLCCHYIRIFLISCCRHPCKMLVAIASRAAHVLSVSVHVSGSIAAWSASDSAAATAAAPRRPHPAAATPPADSTLASSKSDSWSGERGGRKVHKVNWVHYCLTMGSHSSQSIDRRPGHTPWRELSSYVGRWPLNYTVEVLGRPACTCEQKTL